MANYAMVSNSEVIEVLHNVHEKPNWPLDTEGNVVHSIECSEDVERGMAYKTETGECYWPEPAAPEKTLEERLEDIETKLDIMSNTEYAQYYNVVNAALLGGE